MNLTEAKLEITIHRNVDGGHEGEADDLEYIVNVFTREEFGDDQCVKHWAFEIWKDGNVWEPGYEIHGELPRCSGSDSDCMSGVLNAFLAWAGTEALLVEEHARPQS